jgi:uncharacterized protein (DUF697 family)
MAIENELKTGGKLTKLRQMLEEAKHDVEELGGIAAFKTGEWVLALVQKSFKSYFANANGDYFRAKYKTSDNDFVADKLIAVGVGNATLLGGLTGLAISGDELLAFFTGGEGGVGLPANIAIATAAIAGEAVLFLKMQLQLVAELAKLYGAPLNPDDPEDILLIIAFALGGAAAEEAGRLGMKITGTVASTAIRKTIRKDVLKALQSVGKTIGIKILQRNIIKYAVPVASTIVGAAWNRSTMKSVGRLAKSHMRERALKRSAGEAA